MRQTHGIAETAAARLDPLMERMVDSYLCWRQRCDAVQETYDRLCRAGREDRGALYAAYETALRREERAARAYEMSARRLAGQDPA